MINNKSTLTEIQAEAYKVLRGIEQAQGYLQQLNKLIAQKEDETNTPKKDEQKPDKEAKN